MIEIFLYIGYILLYFVGMIISGKFFKWMHENFSLRFSEVMRFVLSLLWFITLPLSFVFVLIGFIVSIVWEIYSYFE